MIWPALLLMACVGFANGANDLSRATATLIGGRVTLYRKAVLWTVSWTLAGSLLSGLLARGVVLRFARALESSGLQTPGTIEAIALAAFLWIAIGTRRGLPISTTHAVLGSIVGVVWLEHRLDLASGGGSNLHLMRGFVLPMLTSPILALLLVWFLRWPTSYLRARSLRWVNQTHWMSSGLVALCRGVNDSAKIWALMLPLAAVSPLGLAATSRLALVTVTAAMALGGLMGGRRVALTVAHRITRMDLHDSLAANVSTALILISASLLGFPVASSHVLGGAVLGTAIAKDKPVSAGLAVQMAVAWAVTLPATALLAALFAFAVTLHLQMLLMAIAILIACLGFLKAAPADPALHQRLFVFVCNANTSRSPMAMWICRAGFSRRLGIPLSSLEQKGIRILSAGLDDRVGEPMTAEAVASLISFGIAPQLHSSTKLTEAMVLDADAIYCMTTQQRGAVIHRFPFAAAKTLRLDRYVDLPNPGGKEQPVYDRVALQIQAAVRRQFTTTLA